MNDSKPTPTELVALATGAALYLVGPRENIFHSLPQVRQFDTWEQCLEIFR